MHHLTPFIVHIKQHLLILHVIPVETYPHLLPKLIHNFYAFHLIKPFAKRLFQLLVATGVVEYLSLHAELHHQHEIVKLKYELAETYARLSIPQKSHYKFRCL